MALRNSWATVPGIDTAVARFMAPDTAWAGWHDVGTR